MRFKMYFWGLLLCVGCTKNENFSDVKIIGHGAVGLHNPSSIYHDNSGEAIDYALGQAGCEGVEIDVQLSKDGSFWLFHDPFLEQETNESGCIPQLNDLFLSHVRYKTLKKERLFRFAELDFSRLKNKTLMLDLRHYDYCAETIIDVQKVVDQLAAFPALINGDLEVIVLLNLKEWYPHFQDFPFALYYYTDAYSDAVSTVNEVPFDGVVMRNSVIRKEEVNWMHSHGKKVIIFEVRSPKGIKSAFKKHPDYLVTDDLKATIIEKY